MPGPDKKSDHIIVTGADANYYGLVRDLLNSLADCGIQSPLAVLDVGFEKAQRRSLEADGVNVVEPEWDIDFPDRAKFPGHFRALTARPFLPRYFPGYKTYMWIDSDTWVQDRKAVELYLATAREGKLAITPHIGRSYLSFKKWQRPRFNTLMFREYRKGWGWRAANALGKYPIANAGIFALAADAPHWDLWKAAQAHGLRAKPTILREQTALNYVIHHDRAPTGLLPDWCNWICIDAPPKLDEKTGMLVEPEPPYRPLGILHLVGPARSHEFTLETLTGKTVKAFLHYRHWRGKRKKPRRG